MSRLILLIIGFVAGWLLKDSDWEVWLEKLKASLAPKEAPEKPIPLLAEEKADKSQTDEIFPDELEKLKGIGPASKTRLNEHGIYTFAQVATLTPEKLKEIAGGRVNTKAVIEQAKELSR